MHNSHWHGKTAVVCGASSGLGREIAAQLAAAHIGQLFLVARRQQIVDQLAQQWSQTHNQSKVFGISADVCDTHQLATCVEQVQHLASHVDLVINAVGRSDRGDMVTLPGDRAEDLFRVNVMSSLNIVQGFHPLMAKPQSSFVFIGSLASLFAPRYLGGYAMAKHALAALAQQTRLELADRGINVLLVCPGPITRADAGQRYADSAADLPKTALQPGGGAKLKGLDASRLATDILLAAAQRKRLLIRPRSARLLWMLSTISPWLGEKILSSKTG